MRLGGLNNYKLTEAIKSFSPKGLVQEFTQKVTSTGENLKNKLELFRSSTEDFPNLNGSINNKLREYLEAQRFYNLEPSDLALKEKQRKLIHDDKELISTKYPVNKGVNDRYSFPISLLDNKVTTRPFFRESERAHDINLSKEISSRIKEDRKKLIEIETEVDTYVRGTIKDDSFPEKYMSESLAEALRYSYPDKKERAELIERLFLENTVDKVLNQVAPKSKLIQLWENAPQDSDMGRFRTATNRLLHPLYEERRDFRLKPELGELLDKYFPFERLKLKPEFLKRDHGLKHSLRLYLNNLKNYEPHLYAFSLNAIKNINAQQTLYPETKAFINIAVHQSETNLPNLLNLLQKQGFNKKECPIYLFINGDNQKAIQERLSDIDKFIKENKSTDPLNLRVVAAEIDHYRHGLKTIPLNLAYMDLALNHNFKKADADIASIYLDADILKFPSKDHVSNLMNGVLNGKIRNHNAYTWNFKELTKMNVHYPIMHALSEGYQYVEDLYNQMNTIFNKSNYKSIAEEGILNSGGHTSYSTMLALLTGATKAHVNNEDPDWTMRASKALAQTHLNSFYDDRHFFQAITNNLPAVEGDEGALKRPMELNRPMRDIWVSHDLINNTEEDLSPINFNEPEDLNVRRIHQEIKIFTQEIMKQGRAFGKEAFKEEKIGDLTGKIIASVLNDRLIALSEKIQESPLKAEDKKIVLKLINEKYKSFFGFNIDE